MEKLREVWILDGNGGDEESGGRKGGKREMLHPELDLNEDEMK